MQMTAIGKHPSFFPNGSDAEMPAKYWHLIHMHTYFKKRTTLLGWLTVTNRAYIEVDPSLLGKEIIHLTGNPVELAWMKPTTPDESLDRDRGVTVNVGIPSAEIDDTAIYQDGDWYTYGVTVNPNDPNDIYLVKLGDADKPPFRFSEEFDLPGGVLANCPNDIHTDVGKFLMNYLILVDPFNDYFPYLNKLFDLGSIEKSIASGILDGKITREQFNTYMNNGYWFGEDASITTATLTPKSITTDPAIKKRRAELLEQHKHELDDEAVISQIERELVAMDRAWLKGDDSEVFYDSDGKKTYNEQRKKMHVSTGLIPGFNKVEGKYEFMPESLRDGCQMEHLDIAANEVRRGSYGRGIETALGGMQSKFILRIFQGLKITEDDCGSRKGIKLKLTKENISTYYGRSIVGGDVITRDNVEQFIGQEVLLRSPMYCKTEGGFCHRCCGELFRKLDMPMAGMNALIITSGFTLTAMKAQHVSSVAAVQVKDIQHYLR